MPLDDVAAAIILRDYLDRAQRPHKGRETDMRRVLLFLLLLVILGTAYMVLALYRPYQGFPSGGVYVDIPHGASQRTHCAPARRKWRRAQPVAFEALCRSRKRSTLEAGEYFFDHPVTAFEVYDTIANGRVYVKEFVVPEGFTMFDIAALAESEGFLSREEFLAAARDPSPIRDHRARRADPGRISVPRNLRISAPHDGKGFDGGNGEAVPASVDHACLPRTPPAHRSVQDVVTLASLVERETPRPEERPHVAGVFENRLRIGQPLQCDPTVAYALMLAGKYSGKLDGDDLHFASPYNTYQNKGLPPGRLPIRAKPRCARLSIPPPTDDLYFVANTEGGHFFSKTLEEHNQNVARYRRLLEQSQNPPGRRTTGSHEQTQAREVAMTNPDHPTKKEMILEIARELSVPRFTPAEVEQIRRQLVARLGPAGKTSPDYIAGVLGHRRHAHRVVHQGRHRRPVRGRISGLASFCDARGRGNVHRAPG